MGIFELALKLNIIMRALFIVYSFHHFLVAVARTENENLESDIVFSNHAFGDGFKEFSERVKKTNIFRNVYYYDERKYPIPSRKHIIKYYIYELYGQKKHFLKEINIDFSIYDHIYLFSDTFTIGAVLSHDKIKYHLLEDAVDSFSNMNYGHSIEHEPISTLKGKMFYLINMGHMLYGNDKSCIDIEVNSINKNTVKLPGEKVIIRDRKEEINSMSQGVKNELLNLFNVNIAEVKGKCALLLTEPLFTDHKADSKEQQLLVYKNLIMKYLSDYQVIIKPHPRDLVDYSSLGYPVLKGKFPIEVLEFQKGLEIDCAITINSSAVNFVDFAKNKILLGLDSLPMLKECIV